MRTSGTTNTCFSKKHKVLTAWGDAIEDAVEINASEVKAGLRAAYNHCNRNRVVRKEPIINPSAVTIGSGAPDDHMTLEDLVDEWATGHFADDDALALAGLTSSADLYKLADRFDFDMR